MCSYDWGHYNIKGKCEEGSMKEIWFGTGMCSNDLIFHFFFLTWWASVPNQILSKRNSPLYTLPPGARRRGVPPHNSLALHLAFSLALLHPLFRLLPPLRSTCKQLHWTPVILFQINFPVVLIAISQAKREFLWLGTYVCAGMYLQWAWYPQVVKGLELSCTHI